jgi:6,7-dimethyl-8-ribityllumazine synthase
MGTRTEGQQVSAKGLRVAVVAAQYNGPLVEQMLEGVKQAWSAAGGSAATLRVEHVPGAFELPLAAQALARLQDVDAVVALGCVIRGDTAHFEYVAGECARGLMRVMLDTGKPVAFGVLTTETEEQARLRAAPGELNKGGEALHTALVMARLLRGL